MILSNCPVPEISTNMKAAQKLNVGLVTTVSGRWPRELPKERHAQYSSWLQETFPEVSLIASDGIAVDQGDVDKAIDKFHQEKVDLVIVLIGAFTGDIAATRIAERLGTPVLLWALFEPEFDGGRLMSNALVAATMNNAALKRLGFRSHFIYGGVEDSRVVKEITSLIGVYKVLKILTKTFMGMIGYRPTGFYSSAFDETLIRRTFGISMEEVDLVHIFNVAETIGEEDIEKDMKAFCKSIKIDGLPDEYLRNHSKLTLAMKRVIADQGFDAVSLRCWPEMGQMKFTPCAMLSRLADEGIIIGCEADVNATISMLIGHSFSGKIPFMCDLIDIDEQENTALFWHCGQAARKLHDDSDNTCVCDHSMAGQGVVIEGTLKPGKVTVSLVVQIGDEYKMFLASGEAVPTKKVIKGVMVNVKMNYPVRDMLYRIAEEGIPHHYSIVWADIADDLKALASHLGIETIET